jgi:hypothetical protein
VLWVAVLTTKNEKSIQTLELRIVPIPNVKSMLP